MTRKKKPSPPRGPVDDPPLDAASRAEMRDKLAAFLPLGETLDAKDAVEAATALITVLDAPGPLRPTTIVPLIMAFEERVAALFEKGIGETTGETQAEMRDGAETAARSKEWLEGVLDQAGHEPD